MENCEIIPLCKNSNILVYNPTLEFFYNRIDSQNYFSFPRQQHGVWDLLFTVSSVDELIPENFKIIAKKMTNKEVVGLPKYQIPYAVSEQICEDLLWYVNMPKPEGLLYGVSDVGFYISDLPPHELDSAYKGKDMFGPRSGFRQRQEIIKKLLPPNEIPFNGVIWRRYAIRGELYRFIEKYRTKKIVLVGPWYFKDFNSRAKLEDYEFIEIDYYRASEKYQEIYKNILSKYYKDAIYFLVGGSLANWLAFKLHESFRQAFIIDIGRALDIYYKDLATEMGWHWLKNL